ncbi:hypothetical protein ACQHGV_13545 [Sphingomonas pseudosanguinis]|uniref:hypothetical protein n=1 Tax=Sphingomonas pseudosanguinis TaxID=413712 RepID=UPI003F854042
MASLPIDPTFARQAPYTPKPNIRVVFLPGPAQTAMAGELAKLPAETQEATLEELEIAALARDVIALAKTRLSTAIYPAFLRWAEAAFHCASYDGSDDSEGSRRWIAACELRDDLHGHAAVSPSDFTLKAYLAEMAADGQVLGPLGEDGIFHLSPDMNDLVKQFDALSTRAVKLTDYGINISPAIGAAARTPFLDAIAGIPVQTPTGLPLRNLLIERNAISDKLNTDTSLDEDTVRAACLESDRLERAITASPAATTDDAIVKLIALAQITATGREVDDTEASQAITEARKHFGIGYTPLETAQPRWPTPITLPQGYDPFMRGPFIQWQRAYEAYAAAKVERTLYEKGEFALASAQYEASVQDTDTEIAFEAKQSRFDQLADAEYEALQALIRCVAPAPTELATKLKLFHDNRMCLDNAPADLLAVIAADARRFGSHGAFTQNDQPLFDAFRKRRAEAVYWLRTDREPATIETEEQSERVALEAEEIIWSTSATTIEGVLTRFKALYPQLSNHGYADRAIVDPSHPEFLRGLKEDSGNLQILWKIMEDLARIGGVNLSEVGA